MSTTHTPSTDRNFRRRWTDFWFAPGDPTTLGFIRIVTGLLILYTHLAYSLDLQAFFGKYGWYGADYVDRERREFPWRESPFFGGWEAELDAQAGMRVPEHPHRRQAVMGFIRSLPTSTAERGRVLAYLDRVARESNRTAPAALQVLINLHKLDPEWQPKVLVGLEEKRQYALTTQDGKFIPLDEHSVKQNTDPMFPAYFLVLPDTDRKTLADDLRAVLPYLPKSQTDTEYLVAHLAELDTANRRAFVDFLKTLPEDTAERTRLIDYVEYWNVDPRHLLREGHPIVSVWFHVTNPTEMALVHALALTVMVLFTIGFCTRVTAVLTWIAVVGYIHRTNQILFGMDTMMNILLIYLMIGNSGAALSVDRLIARYRAARASLRRTGTIDAPTRAFLERPPLTRGANLGIRLIQVHFCFIYMAAGLSKLKGPAWWNGNAFWDVMINPEFTLLRQAWFESMMRNIASIKPLYYTITAVGVWFTWGLEIAFPFLVWTRVRPVMVWMAVLLHAGIGVLMGLNLFELLMMTMLLVFLPPGVIRDRLRGGPDLKKFGFGFDAADPKQARAAAAVAAVDVDSQVNVEPRRDRDLPVVTAGGSTTRASAAVRELFDGVRMLRIFRFVRFVPGVSGAITRFLFPVGTPPTGGPRTGPQTPAVAS